MPIHARSAELRAPSVVAGRAPIAGPIREQRRSLQALLRQCDAYELLLLDAAEDELDDAVAGKYESFGQTLVAFRRHVARVQDAQQRLSTCLRNFEEERADIIATMDASD